MGTVTTFTDKQSTCGSLTGGPQVAEFEIDFAKTSVSAADVVQVANIAANTFVHNVFIRVITAEGATCTATVGDASDADGWDASTNLNATAGTVTYGIGGTDAYCTTNGKLYSSADTIDLTMGHDTDAAKILVTVLYTNLAGSLV